jgi:S1-C subfamily serine protease
MKIAAISVTIGLIGGAAAFVLTSRSSTPSPTLTSATSVATAPRAIQPTAASMVGLRITTAGTPGSEAAGLIVDGGALVVTTAIIPAGSAIEVITQERRSIGASVVATDPIAGVSILRPAASLPTPVVSAAASEGKGSATEVWVATGAGGASTIAWTSARVMSTDAPVVVDSVGIGTMTDASSSAASAMPGTALVAPDGSLLGIAAPRLGLHHWLPASMIEELATSMPSEPTHACLKIEGETARLGGVEVVSVEAASPVAGVLEPGDVIEAIGTTRVRTISELLDDLYAMSPGTSVSLSIDRHGTTEHVGVTLDAST